MLQPGHVLNGTYCVEQLLGAGGMADVYLVRHTRLPRQFALKLMLGQVANQPGVRERFRLEAEILAKLRHNHIVGVVDWDTTPGGRPYLVMEYIEGETLATFLRRTGPLSPAVAIDICRQIADGLSAAHSAGVVHRDLKPSNIFLDKNGGGPNHVKILDFGIAKLVRTDQPLTKLNTGLIGTPGYMSPEQVTGGIVDNRSDQFALALMLFEMLTGQSPFSGVDDTALAILARIVHEPAPRLPVPEIDAAVQRALSKSPEDRFPSIDAFMGALGAGGRSGFVPGPTPVPAPSSDGNGELSRNAQRSARLRLRRIVPGMALGVVLSVVTVLGFAGKLRRQPQAGLVPASTPSRAAAPSSPTTLPGRPEPSSPVPPSPGAPPSPTRPAASAQAGPSAPGRLPSELTAPLPPVADVSGQRAGFPVAEHSQRMLFVTVEEESRFVGFNAPPAPAGPPIWAISRIVQFCFEQKLKGVALPAGSEIVLERTNTLKVTSPRPSHRREELELCLAQQLDRSHYRTPRRVTVRVRYSQ